MSALQPRLHPVGTLGAAVAASAEAVDALARTLRGEARQHSVRALEAVAAAGPTRPGRDAPPRRSAGPPRAVGLAPTATIGGLVFYRAP